MHAKIRKHLNMARERVEALRKFLISSYGNFDYFFSEKLVQKDRTPPPKANALPARVQRPTPPRHIASAPSVSIA
jgi:hypothetical protein